MTEATTRTAVSPFSLDVFEDEPPYDEVGGLTYAKATIEKTFTGDLVATSHVEMLSVRGDRGAGYVALETVRGALDGRAGSFALLHVGTMAGEEIWARWPIAPGSGTGELEGIHGEARIEIAPDGAHTLYLDYGL